MSSCPVQSLFTQSAIGWGIEELSTYESSLKGMQWAYVFTPADERSTRLTFGAVMVMFLVDTAIQLLLAYYIETVFPGTYLLLRCLDDVRTCAVVSFLYPSGKYGIARRWYFPVQKSYWCGKAPKKADEHLGGVYKGRLVD